MSDEMKSDVKRWNAAFHAGGVMQEHNGSLIRSGIGPYVLADDYDRLKRTLDAVENARRIEHEARRRLQKAILDLCAQHVGSELASDRSASAGNSHHE